MTATKKPISTPQAIEDYQAAEGPHRYDFECLACDATLQIFDLTKEGADVRACKIGWGVYFRTDRWVHLCPDHEKRKKDNERF